MWFQQARMWFQHAPDWFLHADCGFHTDESKVDTYACKYDTLECDFYTHMWGLRWIDLLIHAECDFHTLECNYDTHVWLRHTRVWFIHAVWLRSVFCTRDVISTDTNVFSTCTRLIPTRRVVSPHVECDFTCRVWFPHTHESKFKCDFYTREYNFYKQCDFDRHACDYNTLPHRLE
jgi:hypothetical protein